jgi:hypothetical protein
MNNQTAELILDPDGLPILTDHVEEEELRAAKESATEAQLPAMTQAEIAEELLSSQIFQQQLDSVAAELASSIRLQVEQTLGVAIENAITDALEDNTVHSFELIRQQLEQALPDMLARVMQDEGVSP